MTELGRIPGAGDAMVRAAAQLADLPAFVSDGSVLGLYRDGDLIASDTDIDFSIYAEPDQERFALDGMTLCRTVDWLDRPIQTAFTDDETGVIVDIFYYYPDLIPGRRVAYCEGGTISNPDLPIAMVGTKYGDLPMPTPIEQYLIERFGDDWQTPQPGKKGLYTEN